jgi:hypothetical protein
MTEETRKALERLRNGHPIECSAEDYRSEIPSVPISLETLSSNSLMSRAKEVFNVSRFVIIIEARESITPKG